MIYEFALIAVRAGAYACSGRNCPCGGLRQGGFTSMHALSTAEEPDRAGGQNQTTASAVALCEISP